MKALRGIARGGMLLVVSLAGVAGAVNIETVPVGNPGNAGEASGDPNSGYGPTRVCGAVAYEYRIGKYEVTAGQYCAFLNAVAASDPYGLYNPYMDYDADPTRKGCNIKRSGSDGSYAYTVASDWANRPVNYVSFWDSCRFANWLENGQGGAGTTETGAYTLDGYNGSDGRTIQRNAGVHWALPSEDEWYKAAYHKNDGVTGNYWDYPTRSDAEPDYRLIDPDSGNNATIRWTDQFANHYTIGSPYWRTEVGAHENSYSAYGTFDQGGNVDEWNEGIAQSGSANRCGRGGNSLSSVAYMSAQFRAFDGPPNAEGLGAGFRVVEIPEPATVLLLGLGAAIILRRRRN